MDMYVKLKLMCMQWRRRPEVFSEVVLFVLEAQPHYVRFWADEFEVTEATLQRWAQGSSAPSTMQRFVVNRFLIEANRNIPLDLLTKKC